ncbi:MAG: tetratricopeptide repeat protein [Acidobacteriota bacterium]
MKPAVCLLLCGVLLTAADTAQAVFERAVKALGAGDYAAAERGFESVLREQPRHVGALGNLGIVYSRTNRADRAIATYRRALRVSPNDEAILVNLGLIYLRQEAHARALPVFKQVVASNPKHLQARLLLSVCRVYTGQAAAAIRDLETLRAASPRDEQILFLLGFAHLKNKEPQKGQAVFAEMLDAVGPARAQFLTGKAYYEAALFSQAEESLLEALRLDPKLPGAHLELGKVYISERRTEDAARELELVLKDNPADSDAAYFLGGMMVQVEARYKEAIPYLERARNAKPDFWAPYFYLGKSRLRLEQAEEAAALLQRAVELNPDEPSAYYHLGRALKACGRNAEARRALDRVRELRAAGLKAVTPGEDQVAGTR